MNYRILRLVDQPELKERAARWFHEKWNIPLSAYLESMEECLKKENAVPQWYVAVEGERIIGGLGVIANDFHNRKDLTPNVCAVFVEEDKRCNGIAGALLQFVCADMKERGITAISLEATGMGRSLYEKYGFVKMNHEMELKEDNIGAKISCQLRAD